MTFYREISWTEDMFERPRPNGMVLEHREVVARFLGRRLTKKECVHHKDEDKRNNSLDNLVVFASQADHARFHKGGTLIDNGDGTFCSEIETKIPERDECPCGNEKRVTSNQCLQCRKAEQASGIPSKEELEVLVWKMPATQVAKKYGVSSGAVKKWCKKLRIQTPARGYWQKLRAEAKVAG